MEMEYEVSNPITPEQFNRLLASLRSDDTITEKQAKKLMSEPANFRNGFKFDSKIAMEILNRYIDFEFVQEPSQIKQYTAQNMVFFGDSKKNNKTNLKLISDKYTKYIIRGDRIYAQIYGVMAVNFRTETDVNPYKNNISEYDDEFIQDIFAQENNKQLSDTLTRIDDSINIELVLIKNIVEGTLPARQRVNYGDVLTMNDTKYSNKFIDNQLDYKTNTYLNKNYRERCCFLTLIIYLYGEQKYIKLDGERKPITYETLAEYFGIENKQSDMALSLNQAQKFFDENRISIRAFNILDECVYERIAEKRNKDIKHQSIYVLIHDNHITLMPLNFETKYRQELKTTEYFKNFKPSNNYFIRSDKQIDECQNKYIVNPSFTEISDIVQFILSDDSKIKTSFRIVSDNISDILFYMMDELNLNPHVEFNAGNVTKIHFGTHHSMTVSDGKRVKNDIRFKFTDKKEYLRFEKQEKKANKWLLNKKAISKYNPVIYKWEKNYPIRPLIGNFTENLNTNVYANGVDMNKAYPSNLFDIKYFPVFSMFDTYLPYDNSPVEDYTMYFIHVKKNNRETKLLFNSEYARTYGYLLNRIDKDVEYKILYYKKPHRLVTSHTQDKLKNIINSKMSNDSDRNWKLFKTLLNPIIGLMGKKNNVNTKTKIFKSKEEAIHFKTEYGGQVLPIDKFTFNHTTVEEDGQVFNDTDNDLEKTYYAWVVETETELNNGFVPIHELVYVLQNLKLYQLYKKLKSSGLNVTGVKTDCIFVSDDVESINNKLKLTNLKLHKNKLNTIKIEEDKKLPRKKVAFSKNELIPPPQFDSQNINIVDEYNITELPPNTLLIGEYPGVGKTETVKRWAHLKKLFVVPYNKLWESFTIDGIDAITLHKLLNISISGETLHHEKFDVSGYDLICFDEIYLNGPDMLERIYTFMLANPTIKFYACGDADQNLPFVGFGNNIADKKEYSNRILNIMFANNVKLTEIKRFNNENDKQKIKEIKRDLLHSNMSITEICAKYNIKTINSMNDLTTRFNITYFNFRANSINEHVDKLVRKENKETAYYYIGQSLVCNKYIKRKDLVLRKNFSYSIIDIEKNVLTIIDECQNAQNITIKQAHEHLKLPYAFTCHAVQGYSITDNFTIFDCNIPYVTREFIWTAITRARNLDQITVFIHCDDEVAKMTQLRANQYFNLKIENYKVQDAEADRKYKTDDYITLDWIHENIPENWRCPCCQCELTLTLDNNNNVESNITVDRLLNRKAHTINNCRVICKICNSGTSHDYEYKDINYFC